MTSTRSTRALVDLARLERNWRRLCAQHAQGRLMTVLKANAYGHGMVPVARFLRGLGQSLFAVALLDEALALRAAGITGRILVLGPPEPGSLALYAAQGIEATVPSLEHLAEAGAAAARTPLEVHLKLDRGMGRIGLREEDGAPLRTALGAARAGLRVRGVFSHFADVERLDSAFCEEQLGRFERGCARVAGALGGRPFERHLANSAGLLRDRRFHFDYARVGFALWAPPAFEPAERAPAAAAEQEQPLTVRTRVSQVKTMHAGESVGYGRTYRCREGEVIATLPIGYGDGYFRRLGNAGAVLLGGQRRPIAGRVSMDQATVSLGSEPCRVGDEAIVLGGGPGGIPVAELGAWAGTNDYEVFTNLGARVPREYRYDGRPVPEP
jgi:alanine racemase